MADEVETKKDPAGYPPFVVTEEEQRRWDLSYTLADAYFADLPDAQRREQTWSATRVFYHSDISTDETPAVAAPVES